VEQCLFVSFPRSGHHWLVRSLQTYGIPDFSYCEYFSSCRTRPCTCDPPKKLQKAHIRAPDNLFHKYIIGFRDPACAIISWYELLRRRNPIKWRRHQPRAVQQWKNWITKWLQVRPGWLLYQYEAMKADREQMVTRVIEHLCPGIEVDQKRLRDGLQQIEIKKTTRDPRTSPYYEDRWVQHVRNYLTKMAKLRGIELHPFMP
jgi:hypothetical protein